MQDTQTVLIIILSIGFAILLALSIALVVILINILNNIRRVTQRVDETSENLGEMVKYLGKKTAPAAISAMASILMRSAKNKINNRKKK